MMEEEPDVEVSHFHTRTHEQAAKPATSWKKA